MMGMRCTSPVGTEETSYNFGMNTKRLIKVGDKTYERMIQFGNRKKKTVFKNRRAYDRKKLKKSDEL
jgi:hypothetical protein